MDNIKEEISKLHDLKYAYENQLSLLEEALIPIGKDFAAFNTTLESRYYRSRFLTDVDDHIKTVEFDDTFVYFKWEQPWTEGECGVFKLPIKICLNKELYEKHKQEIKVKYDASIAADKKRDEDNEKREYERLKSKFG